MDNRVYISVTRKHPFTDEEVTIVIRADPNDFWKWKDGALIQDAFPYLSADEREFIVTGIPPGEWDKWMKDEP
jgi:hypothetical protein